MGRKCIVTGCINRKDRQQGKDERKDMIHRFPSPNLPSKRKMWTDFAAAASKDNTSSLNFETFGLCARHFKDDDYEMATDQKNAQWKKLKLDAVPSILLKTEEVMTSSLLSSEPVTFSFDESNSFECYERKLVEYSWEAKYNAEVKRRKQLEQEVIKLESVIAKFTQKEAAESEKMQNIMSRFSCSQQRMLQDPTLTRVQWGDDDMIRGLSLFSISPKGYELVREQWRIPLPSGRTLQRYLEMIPIVPDEPFPLVFQAINRQFIDTRFDSLMTQCLLGLDEVATDDRFCYDRKLDQIYGGVKYATVFCAKGLFNKSWKMPLQYTFNQSSHQLLNLITLLYENGVNVVACVSDMGPKNQRIWKELGIGAVEKGVIQRINFNHPVTGGKIFWFPDFPHLIKLLRDHLLEKKITLESGTVMDKSWLEEIINQQRGEMKLTHKLNQKHLHIRGQQKQNVRTAFQIFSHTTATAFRVLLKGREGCDEVANTFDLINDVSDILNSRICHAYYNKYQCAFGMYFDEQSIILHRALDLFSSMTVGIRANKSFAPFQKGLIWNILSLLGLYEDLKERLERFEFIRGDRLTQDFIENLYSILRSYGGQNNNPDPVQFRYRLRKLVVTWSIASGEVEEFRIQNLKQLPNSGCHNPSLEECERPTFSDKVEEELSLVDPMIAIVQDYQFDEMNKDRAVREGSKEYIAGYIAKKMILSYPELSAKGAEEGSRNGWISKLSKGGLTEPSAYWFTAFSKFEEYFNTIHPPDSVCREAGIVKKLTLFLHERHPNFQLDIIKFYAHCRTRIRIKYLNIRMTDEKIIKRERKRLGEDGEQDDVRGLTVEGEHLMSEFGRLF